MLSEEQKLLLAQLVRDNKAVVLAPFSSKVTKKATGMGNHSYAIKQRRYKYWNGMEWNDLFNVEDVGSVCTIFRARSSC